VLRQRQRHRVFDRHEMAFAAARIVGVHQQLRLRRLELAVDQALLHVVPTHVGHEQADVDVAGRDGRIDVDESRGGIADLVELHDRKRWRLESLAEIGVVVTVGGKPRWPRGLRRARIVFSNA